MKQATTTTIIFITALVFCSAAQALDRQIIRRDSQDLSDASRVALVVGNADYAVGGLKNPVNDARDMAGVLKSLGFEVMLKTDLDRRAMFDAIRDFGDRLRGDKVGLFYYSGHGIRVGNANYLLPVGADIQRADEVRFEAVPADLVLNKMNSAENPLNLVILDACRNNPYARSWHKGTGETGLASMTPPTGTLIFYATKPGAVAADGDGHNSPFTASLKTRIRESGLDVLRLVTRVAGDVMKDTGGRQEPWMEGMILGDFYFADSGGAVVQTPMPPAPKPKPKQASLSITSDVSGSTVWINGQKMGGSPPLNYPNIRPGYYRVKVGKDGYETHEEKVTVEPGVAYEVKAYLEKIAQAPAPVPVAPEPEPAARNRFTNSLGMEFVRIPAGSFTMGSPEDEPGRDSDEKQHRVTLNQDYFMGTTEVTVGQWRRFVADSGFSGDGTNYWKCDGMGDPEFSQDERHPVTCVSWNDAGEFINWLNQKEGKSYRLPTEAEWEYAARAGTTAPFTYGRCLSTDQANYDGNYPLDGCPKGKYRKKTIPVGSLNAPNGHGLHDMHGNVWEWCQDWYGDYPSSSVTDPAGPSSGPGRVLRGGGWFNGAGDCRSADRYWLTAGSRLALIGFRLVLPAGR